HAERIAGTFPTIAAGGILEPKLAKDLEEADAFGIGMLDRAFHALVTGDIDSANEVIDSQAHHQKMMDALSHRVAVKKGEELLALGLVVNSLGRTGSYAADIAEQAINLAILSEPQAT
ncbi:MAG: PhoU domain-containing protein, partial [Thermoplasmata archaeon]